MVNNNERPKFLPSFFAALSERAEKGTLWRIFVAPLVAGTVGGTIAYFIPARLWSNDELVVAATVYTGVLTLNGLILALSWSAFSRIYESISSPKFCAFLRRNNLLNKYIVTVSFVHGLQLLAIIASASGLFTLLFDIQYIFIYRIIFGIMLFTSIYAVYQAASAVSIMHDLIWQKAVFDEHTDQNGDSTVLPFGNRNE